MDEAFGEERVAAKFSGYAGVQPAQMTALRELIYEVAAAAPGVGRLEETLKWASRAT